MHLCVVSWNCRRAASKSALWDHLLALDPDVGLLQEVGAIPAHVSERYDVSIRRALGKTGRPQAFSTAVLVRGRINAPVTLRSGMDWVDAELDRFAGNLVAHELETHHGVTLTAASVYSPAWPVDPARLAGVDTRVVRLSTNPDVWLTDLVRAGLRHHSPAPTDHWVVGGDLNSSETFDSMSWSNGGNREYLEGMAALGWVECLRKSQGALTPTFRNTTGGRVVHQMDHLFATPALATRLVSCETGSHEAVFGANLSDHLPIVAKFEM